MVSGVSTFVIALIFSFYILLQKEKLSRQGRQVLYALLLDRGHMAAAGEIGAVLTGNRLAEVYGMDVLGWLREMLRCWETPLTRN